MSAVASLDSPFSEPYISLDMAHPETAAQPRDFDWRWWTVAIVTILLGYLDLARGGTTLAPILLVAGYCVLVPLAILK